MKPRRSAPVSGTGLSMALLALVLAAPAFAQTAKDPVSEKREQIQQIRAEREQMERRLEVFKLSEKETTQEIDQLSDSVKASRNRKSQMERDLVRTQAERAEQDKEMEELTLRIRGSQQRIGKRLRRLYRLAKAEDSAALFQLARFNSFAKDTFVLSRLQAQDAEALKQFETLAGAVKQKQQDVRQTLAHLESLKGELDEERKLLTEREGGLRESLKNLRKNQELYGQYLGELEKSETAVESALVKMEATPAATQQLSGDPSALRGKLPPPTQGTVVAKFGQQDPRYQLKKFQRGIAIRVAEGAPVNAVAGGSVVHAGPFRGFQDLVVLDHGKGLYTVYGHLEGLTVQKGQWANAGAVLGKGTYLPEDEAYTVYFEIRVNGKPEDPLEWLERGKLKVAAN
ncbi:MAG TPA: peptidoglycan DD-metalloendopeptidase family protein [bacterium]